MNVYTESSNIEKQKNTVVTIGTFDGIHKGHRKILDLVLNEAEKNNGRSFVVTFEPHPRTVVAKNFQIRILTSLEEKVRILSDLGINNLMVVNFTKEFSQQTSEEFIKKYICEKIGASHIIIGHDHKFGKDRGGDENTLKKLGEKHDFDVTTVGPVSNGDEVISSTKIRNAIAEGDVEKANTYLTQNYSLKGKVVKGASRGRILGFPTANIELKDRNKLIPKYGVYVTKCFLDEVVYYGVMNIGIRPTFEDNFDLVIEVHLLDFDEDIYGKDLRVDVIKRIRDEKKFKSKEELIEQIEKDKQDTISFLNTLNN